MIEMKPCCVCTIVKDVREMEPNADGSFTCFQCLDDIAWDDVEGEQTSKPGESDLS